MKPHRCPEFLFPGLRDEESTGGRSGSRGGFRTGGRLGDSVWGFGSPGTTRCASDLGNRDVSQLQELDSEPSRSAFEVEPMVQCRAMVRFFSSVSPSTHPSVHPICSSIRSSKDGKRGN